MASHVWEEIFHFYKLFSEIHVGGPITSLYVFEQEYTLLQNGCYKHLVDSGIYHGSFYPWLTIHQTIYEMMTNHTQMTADKLFSEIHVGGPVTSFIPCWMLQVCLFSVHLLFELPRNWTSVLSRRVGAHTNDSI
ncbi:hypothetical protein OIU74_027530 [Salix koriyanagi]|uniref:Uncharacterized protein n=1 Tax=Salix koriyanagi TaxID=2511006 RepID=A0A9Q0VQ47_9ROSI|nr:hypothetical protein OIU74_027530 [Salix koriyanagi]